MLHVRHRRRPAFRLVVWAALGACSGDTTGDTAGAVPEAGDPDAAWSYEGELARPEWTAEDAGAALGSALAEPFPVPIGVFQTYGAVMSLGDERCPGPELTFEKILGCTADSGWWYAGVAGFGETDQVEGDNPFVQDDLYADMQALAPDGRRFAIGGSANQHLGENREGQATYSGFLEGIFIFTDGSILDPAVDALIDYGAGETAGGRRWVSLDGAVGFSGSYLEFQDVTIAGDTCPTDAVGTVRIRDATDHWYALELGDDCDGCGTVYFNGTEAIGEACVSLENLGLRLAESLLTPWR